MTGIVIFGVLLAISASIYKDLLVPLRQGYLRVYLILGSGEKRRYWVKINPIDNNFTIGEDTYDVVASCVVRMGRLRVPTSEYIKGFRAPIDYRATTIAAEKSNKRPSRKEIFVTDSPKPDSKPLSPELNSTSSREYHTFVKQDIIAELYAAFKKEFLSPAMQLLIILVAIGVVGLGLGYYLGQKLDGISDMLTFIHNEFQAVYPTTGVTPNG